MVVLDSGFVFVKQKTADEMRISDWSSDVCSSDLALRGAMEAEGKGFAYNTRRCNNGHTLKSRPGHCIQCRPVVIGFLKRHFAEGYVYIAVSVDRKRVE